MSLAHVLLAMYGSEYTMILFILARGHPLTPNENLVASIITAIIGLYTIWIGFCSEANRLRWGFLKNRSTPREPRFFSLCLGLGFICFAIASFGSGYKHWFTRVQTGRLMLAMFLLACLGASYAAFVDWRRRGFPIFSRCSRCGKGLDFRISHTCRPSDTAVLNKSSEKK